MRAIVRVAGLAAITSAALLITAQANSQSGAAPSAADLAAEIQALKREYDARIRVLETQLSTIEAESQAAQREAASSVSRVRRVLGNAFNPSIGVVLNGMYTDFSADESEIPGFQAGHESERAAEGLSLGHSEVTVSSNIDDKFYGNLTLGFGVHPGEPTEIDLEEAFIQTLPGAGLPEGLRIKAGRALWTFGYLNELHAHGDDFSDRPLPYRVFLDNAYNDEGIELSFVLPTDLYGEIGGGLFRGDDTPFGGSDNGREAWSAYVRLGGDIGRDSAWRIGGYVLDGEASGRGGGDEEHAHDEEESGEEEHDPGPATFFSDGRFTGETRLHGVDLRYTWAPTGNARNSELILQGEYFWRTENGTYVMEEESNDGGHHEEFEADTTTSGWYAQTIYKFRQSWRVGARYARLSPPGSAEIGHDPYTVGVMTDWTNSEFGRIRLQYNREALSEGERDDQFILQYIMSLGAHPAHTF